jgi:hypothetical protein
LFTKKDVITSQVNKFGGVGGIGDGVGVTGGPQTLATQVYGDKLDPPVPLSNVGTVLAQTYVVAPLPTIFV